MATGSYGSDNYGNGQGSFDGSSGQTEMGWGERSPFLQKWDRAPVLPAVAGCALSCFLYVMGNAMDSVTSSNATGSYVMILVVSLAVVVISVVYAASIYPSLFKERNSLSSPGFVSFLNFFLGGPLFGALWNHNLTRKMPGISHKVYVVLMVVGIVGGFLLGLA